MPINPTAVGPAAQPQQNPDLANLFNWLRQRGTTSAAGQGQNPFAYLSPQQQPNMMNQLTAGTRAPAGGSSLGSGQAPGGKPGGLPVGSPGTSVPFAASPVGTGSAPVNKPIVSGGPTGISTTPQDAGGGGQPFAVPRAPQGPSPWSPEGGGGSMTLPGYGEPGFQGPVSFAGTPTPEMLKQIFPPATPAISTTPQDSGGGGQPFAVPRAPQGPISSPTNKPIVSGGPTGISTAPTPTISLPITSPAGGAWKSPASAAVNKPAISTAPAENPGAMTFPGVSTKQGPATTPQTPVGMTPWGPGQYIGPEISQPGGGSSVAIYQDPNVYGMHATAPSSAPAASPVSPTTAPTSTAPAVDPNLLNQIRLQQRKGAGGGGGAGAGQRVGPGTTSTGYYGMSF